MGSNTEKDLVQKIKSNNTSDVYDALVKIRKCYVRSQSKMKKLQKYSVIELIVAFLEHPKFCNISLSIIADGCLELSFVNEVIKYNGINSLMRIMKSMLNEDIQNRACRALGNIAKFEVGFKAVHHMKPVSIIINFLSGTGDVNCQQTAVRTLMILGKSAKTRELIAQENGIVYIAKLLYSSDPQVLICSIKALASLTQNCNISCARQLLELQFLQVIVELHSHSEKCVRNHALISLKNLSCLEEIRSDLVKVGAVKLFTEVLTSCESCEMGRLAAMALCSCLDHIHMWSHNGVDRAVGLRALLVVLKNKRFQDIHMHIIASLIPLSYESKVSDILLSLDVLQILIESLEIYIEKNKCKSGTKTSCKSCEKKMIKSDSIYKKDKYYEILSSGFQFGLTNNSYIKYTEDIEVEDSKNNREDSFESKTSVFLDKSQDSCLSKSTPKWDRSLYSFSSITSDYSGSCSPSGICSPMQKLSSSPEANYETDLGSPSIGHASSSGVWSPVSLLEENLPTDETCWSPVVSTDSNSVILENEFDDNQETVESFTSCTKNTISDVQEADFLNETSKNSNFALSHSADEGNRTSTLKNKINCNSKSLPICLETEVKSKKIKLQDLNKEFIGYQPQLPNVNDVKSDAKCISYDHIKLCNSKYIIESEVQTIDHYIILFILQLSFHIKKKTNSQIADKMCFSVLIDYLCLIHNPSHKAETVLLNLIKNRYCFEKLILNGFVSELEEKMTSPNYFCIHRSCVKLIYSKLISVGREEVESDYGIGTLSHILVTSEKTGQFHAICAASKLVTEKAALFRLLFQANGLSLLLDFLCDDNILIQKKAVISLCELYQSLTKEQKNEKCCFEGTCSMKTSSKCLYKESFLNVTFSVVGGVKILANREKICENSEYFNALLTDNFLEKNAELVSLPNISAENLSTIFHFLHGCGSGKCCPFITRIPFSVLLELLSDCEQFLLMNIKVFIEDRLCHRLFPATVPKIYRQSKIHNSPELTKRSLDFALSMDTLQKDLLWNCFEELINLGSNLDFFGDIEKLLKSVF